MKNNKYLRKNGKIFPYVVLPSIIGVITGVLIFLFKVASSKAISLSEWMYSAVRENPIYLPTLVAGVSLLGVVAAIILKYAKECRGGGIPTAVAAIRGLIPIKWMQGIFGLFVSSLSSYLAGVPLGNEGPSVQMGTAVGKGASELLGKRHHAWQRYIMTGGACSGFAVATGAPISGIMFALEEAHRRFSPAIFIVASVSVLTGSVTQEMLSSFFGVNTTFFNLEINTSLPFEYFWAPLLVGIACGAFAILFTKAYKLIKRIGKKAHLPFVVKIVIIFAAVAILGFFSEDFVGSGHSLIEKILSGRFVWFMLVLAFLVRAILMIFANNEGVSGGIFVPTLAFGAIISALIAYGLISANALDERYFGILVVVGMVSFLSAVSRIPLTAIVFAAEALCAVNNILPAVIGVVISYLVVEISGRISFTDAVIEAKTEAEHRGKIPIIIDAHMSVQPNSFAVGMEMRDVLWPPTCVVLSVDRKHSLISHHTAEICIGDVFHIHYQTYDLKETEKMLTDILGEQPKDKNAKIHFGSDDHIVPE